MPNCRCPSRWHLIPLVVLGVACQAQEAKKPTPAVAASAELPVILLTGFEPFGPGRPANSWWEGIKSLDCKTFNGHRLVSRQLEVVWGAPLAKLEGWINELHPVAVFSFGQGGGSFAIETQAA